MHPSRDLHTRSGPPDVALRVVAAATAVPRYARRTIIQIALLACLVLPWPVPPSRGLPIRSQAPSTTVLKKHGVILN